MTRRRLSTVTAVTAAALLGIGVSAHAAPILWDFNPSVVTGPVGAPSYSVDSIPSSGILLTAAGFDIAGAPYTPAFGDIPHDLFWKQEGVDEHGIGLVGTADNELTLDRSGNPANYIRLDLNNIYTNPAVVNAQIRIQSTTGFEAWDLFGWNGVSYVLLESRNLDNNVFRPLPFWGTYRGYAVTTSPDPAHPENNVLVDAIAAEVVPVPEPGTLALLAGGLAMLASRRKASRSARR